MSLEGGIILVTSNVGELNIVNVPFRLLQLNTYRSWAKSQFQGANVLHRRDCSKWFMWGQKGCIQQGWWEVESWMRQGYLNSGHLSLASSEKWRPLFVAIEKTNRRPCVLWSYGCSMSDCHSVKWLFSGCSPKCLFSLLPHNSRLGVGVIVLAKCLSSDLKENCQSDGYGPSYVKTMLLPGEIFGNVWLQHLECLRALTATDMSWWSGIFLVSRNFYFFLKRNKVGMATLKDALEISMKSEQV